MEKGVKMQAFKVLIERDSAGFYVANVPELEGCFTQAKTERELMRRVIEVINLCLKDKDPQMKEIEIKEVKVPMCSNSLCA